VSSYIACIAVFLLVLTPLAVPTAVSIIHAIGKWRPNSAVTDRAIGLGRQTLRPAV
jgi:hypothetical protein